MKYFLKVIPTSVKFVKHNQIIIFMILLFLSCTKKIIVNKTEYDKINCYGACVYRIETKTHEIYEFQTCEISNDTLFIDYTSDLNNRSKKIAISFEEINKIERIAPGKGTSYIFALSTTILISIFIYVIILSLSGAGGIS